MVAPGNNYKAAKLQPDREIRLVRVGLFNMNLGAVKFIATNRL